MSALNASAFAALLQQLSIKRRVFVSYHHAHDQPYYDLLSAIYADTYETIMDTSLDRIFDSEDSDYVIRRIREEHISGSSCTIVLCGPETRWRKYVDWEIKATLDKCHGLLAVRLPNLPVDIFGRSHKPDRLQDNIDSGYAIWTDWASVMAGPAQFRALIERAVGQSALRIRNGRPLRSRNGSAFPS